MKKTLLTVACAATALYAEAQCSIKATLTDISNDTVKVVTEKNNDGENILAKNGSFTFSCSETSAQEAAFLVKTAEGIKTIQTYLIPGEKGEITGSTVSYSFSGTAFYNEYNNYHNTIKEERDKMNELLKEFRKKVAAGEKRDSLSRIIGPQYEGLVKELQKKALEYIKANPAKDVSAIALTMVAEPEMETAIALLAENVKEGPAGNYVKQVQSLINEEKARQEAAKLVADGMMAPDFTLKDLEGKDLSLSSLRGKYVVLDFWGSWCVWCIKGIPEMKKYYEKYSGKMEILGVDCNDTEAKWRDAVAKHQIPWKHVFNPRNSDLTTKYAIEGFPTKIIIDPQGKIVKTVVGEDPAFYAFLDELLK